MKEETRKLILDWMRKIHTMEYASRFTSIRWKNLNLWLGIPALIIGISIGAVPKISILSDSVQVIIPIGGMIIAILTGLQTFLKPTEKAESYRKMSVKYEELRHKVEIILQADNEDTAKLGLERIRKDWSSIDSLNVSNKAFKDAKVKVKGFKKYPEELGFLETIS
ncbi:SLATT domain-containing protein [Chitinophaga ginsengisoli]|nr:SLATT domain-containing protein [Chitinophaga ginsengisoli]